MMGRVEIRMYKRRQKRAKMLRRLLLGLLATTAVILLWRKLPVIWALLPRAHFMKLPCR